MSSVMKAIRHHLHNLADFIREYAEQLLRILLFLPRKRTRRAQVNQDLTALQTGQFNLDRRWQDFHAQPRREYYLNAVLDHIRYPVSGMSRWVSGKWASLRLWYGMKFVLPRTREFSITSPHIHYPGHHDEAECYLNFGSHSISITVCTADYINAVAEESWVQAEPCEPPTMGSMITLIAPVGEFNNEVITQTVKNWYMDRFYWEYRHWSHQEHKTPTFTNEVVWEAAPTNLQTTAQSRENLIGYLEKRGEEMKAAYGEAKA